MSAWKHFGDAHTWVYQRSGGRIGARMAGRDMLLLTTTGRRSGEPRTLPLAYLADGDALVIVASNAGQSRHPAWFHNLRAEPHARVRVGREVYDVRAEVADAAERERLWPLLTAYNPPYAAYERKTERTIPVVLLRPMDRSA
jgi:deazaflavin-dependent oxidoreductase (nitroreductase family)